MTLSKQPADLSKFVGTANYYRVRHQDFASRHPEQDPPSYYLDYGDHYMHRFVDEVGPSMNSKGREWILKTRAQLQEAIELERTRDPVAFDELEQNEECFLDFCYQTHPKAYLDSGLEKLNPIQWLHIALTPDSKDLLNPRGLKQVFETTAMVVKRRSYADLAKLGYRSLEQDAKLKRSEQALPTWGKPTDTATAKEPFQTARATVLKAAESLAMATIPVLEPLRLALWSAFTRSPNS